MGSVPRSEGLLRDADALEEAELQGIILHLCRSLTASINEVLSSETSRIRGVRVLVLPALPLGFGGATVEFNPCTRDLTNVTENS